MAATKKQQTPPAVMDPKFEWAEKAGSYVLRVKLPGFSKADLRVQVDAAGRITVRGTRTGTAGTTSLCKVFQLPSAASHDDIAGRFEAGVLTLTVPKRTSSSTTTSIAEIKRKLPGVAKPKEEDASKKEATDQAAAVAADKEAKAEQEKKAMVECVSSWKERAMGELKGLTDMKWADGMVKAARNNKEVVAVAIAAFSVGFLVSQKLFRK